MTNGEVVQFLFHQLIKIAPKDCNLVLIMVSPDGSEGQILSTADKADTVEIMNKASNDTVMDEIER